MRLAALLLVLITPACATMMRPTHDPLPIDSEPRGATIYCQGAAVGVTPCTVAMPHGVHEVLLRLDGHHDRLVQPGTSGRNGLLFLSFIMWGPFGLVFDALTGAGTMVKTDPVHVDMAPLSEPAPPAWVRSAGFDAWAPIEPEYRPMR